MTTYERITFVLPDSGKRCVVYAADVRERHILGATLLSFAEVTRDGEKRDRLHLLDASLVRARVPMRMNLKYGQLEETTAFAREPRYGD